MKPLWIWTGGRIQCGIFRVGDDCGISIRAGLLIQNSQRAGSGGKLLPVSDKMCDTPDISGFLVGISLQG